MVVRKIGFESLPRSECLCKTGGRNQLVVSSTDTIDASDAAVINNSILVSHKAHKYMSTVYTLRISTNQQHYASESRSFPFFFLTPRYILNIIREIRVIARDTTPRPAVVRLTFESVHFYIFYTLLLLRKSMFFLIYTDLLLSICMEKKTCHKIDYFVHKIRIVCDS